jgi:uncharacterized membrane protein
MSSNRRNVKLGENNNSGNYRGPSKVIERNIRKILKLRIREAQKRNFLDRIADMIALFSGRMFFIYAHILWFGLWVFINTGIFGIKPFDPFPYSGSSHAAWN